MASLLAIVMSGCAEELDTTYGRRTGLSGGESVNGTAVLARMFQRAGHRVSDWHWLSPKLRNDADCIVWCPDDFQPPTDDVRQWFQSWLEDDVDRTLIYIGRDFNAAQLYWEKVRDPTLPQPERAEINRRLAESRNRFRTARKRLPSDPEEQDCQWFTVSDQWDFVEVQDLTSDAGWLDGVDTAKTEIRMYGRLKPADAAEILLSSDAGPLVSRLPVEESQIIIVANGSFLLNLTLVNHEHRKLAARLIEQIGPSQRVFFLQSSSGGLKIIDDDPSAELPHGVEIFGVAPGAMWHLVALGILFCLCRLPVFGVPRQSDDMHRSDFGRHVKALGVLLQRTKNRDFAMKRVISYQQIGRGESIHQQRTTASPTSDPQRADDPPARPTGGHD